VNEYLSRVSEKGEAISIRRQGNQMKRDDGRAKAEPDFWSNSCSLVVVAISSIVLYIGQAVS
jgi:hypothetical protein